MWENLIGKPLISEQKIHVQLIFGPIKKTTTCGRLLFAEMRVNVAN